VPKTYGGWEKALTVLDDVHRPFIPERPELKTVVADLAPGSAGFPPHRHSGPSFYYMLEGELKFELDGELPRVMRAGEAFWEPGGDVTHVVNANNRDDMRCRFVVTMMASSEGAMRELVPSASDGYDAAWESALTVMQKVQPPFIFDDAHAMTVIIDYSPGSAGAPPHKHLSGPAFGYVIEGEMLLELEGEPPRVIRAGQAFWEPGGDVVHYSDANNRDDARCRFMVTMLCVPGQPMLTLVDEAELESRAHLRVRAVETVVPE
jgi:quercetin dioxygenase-like cupin family protein